MLQFLRIQWDHVDQVFAKKLSEHQMALSDQYHHYRLRLWNQFQRQPQNPLVQKLIDQHPCVCKHSEQTQISHWRILDDISSKSEFIKKMTDKNLPDYDSMEKHKVRPIQNLLEA